MNKTYTLQVCLEDFKSGRQGIEFIFDLIEKVKAAVFAQSGKVVSYSFSNQPNRDFNIDGNVGTLSFEILTHDDYVRELTVEYYAEDNYFGKPPNICVMISFCRSASTKAPWSSLDPGVGESRSVRAQSS